MERFGLPIPHPGEPAHRLAVRVPHVHGVLDNHVWFSPPVRPWVPDVTAAGYRYVADVTLLVPAEVDDLAARSLPIRIEVDSEPGRGSCFIVRIPLLV